MGDERKNGHDQRPFFHPDRERKGKISPVHPADYNGVAFPNATLYTDGAFINFENVMQYEFYNYSNVPVMINGLFLDRYFAGSPTSPTYLQTRSSWIPKMLSNEADTSNYQLSFLDSYYTGINAYHRFYVVKKLFALVQPNREEF